MRFAIASFLIISMAMAVSTKAPAPSQGPAAPAITTQTRSILKDVVGPMPAIAATPLFGLAVLSGLGLITRMETVQRSDIGLVTSLRQNALIQSAERHSSPGIFATLVCLAMLGYAVNSGKLQGVVGKLFRAGEDLTSAVVYVLLSVSAASASGLSATRPAVALAGMTGSTEFLALLLLTGLAAMMATRFAFDIIIWLIPFPFIDFLFETGKKIATVTFIGLYLFFPGVAFFLSIVILIVSLFAFRWALRLIRFAFSITLRPLLAIVFPSVRSGLVHHPLSSYGGEGASSCDILTPGAAIVLVGVAKRKVGAVVLRSQSLSFVTRSRLPGKPRHTPLAAEGDRLVLVRTLAWVELRVLDSRGRMKACIALPNTILPHLDAMRVLLRAEDGGHTGLAKMLVQPPAFNRPRPGTA